MTSQSMSIPDRGPVVFAVTTATLVLSSLFVFSRLVCRIGIVRRVAWDDYFITLAWLLAFGLSLTIDLGTRNGLGRHDVDIPSKHIAALRRCEYVFSILYNPALMATKTSILIFYLRLSKNTEKILRLCSYAVLAIVNVAGIVLTFLNIFQCRPITSAFTPNPGTCIPLLTEFICSAPVNILTDLAILALPLPVLTAMRLPSRQKFILVFTFALGVFVTVVDVVRIYYLQQAISSIGTGTSSNPASLFIDSTEFSWNAAFSLMWSAIEVNIGITCACIPTLKPLVAKILPTILVNQDGTLKYFSGTREAEVSDTPSQAANRQQEDWARAQSRQPSQATDASNSESLRGPQSATSPSMVAEPRPSRDPDLSVNSDTTLGASRMTTADRPHNPSLLDSSRQYKTEHPNMLSTQQIPDVPPPTLDDDLGDSQFLSLGTAGDQMRTGTSFVTKTTNTENALYFGFVAMKKPKRMLDTSVSESLQFCTVVAVLFFLWGFSYGLLNTLNNAVSSVSDMTRTQTLGLTSAYFGGGYLFGPLLVGEWVLRHDEHHRRRSVPAQQKRHDGRALSSLSSAALAHIHANPYDEMIGGFKATFIVGLCIYGTGTIMFWPSAVLTSFPGFLISNFVVGFGLSVLETAANPFLALCGPMEYSEMRLLLAQGLQGASSVVSGLLAQKVFFASVGSDSSANSMSLLDVQWTYLAITLFCAALAMFFYYMPLPEVHDAELERLVGRLSVDGTKRTIFGGLQLRTVCLILAVISQWMYVASQECMSLYFDALVTSWLPVIRTADDSSAFNLTDDSRSLVSRLVTSSSNPADNTDNPAGLALSVTNYLLISRTAFAVSRFAVGYLSYLAAKHPGRRWLPSPLTMLTISIALSALFALLSVVLRPTANANLVVIPVSLLFFAEGPIYPLIFAIGLRGQGKRTKRASAWLTVGASGPLFWPFVMYGIIDRGGSVRTSFIVVVCLLAFAFVYPLYLTFFKDAGQLCKLAPTKPLSSRCLNNGAEQISEDGLRLEQDATQRSAATSQPEPSGEMASPDGHGDMLKLPTPPLIAHRPAGHPIIGTP